MRVTVVGTVHTESGLANEAELLAIIERLSPEVIFAEIPSTHIEQYRDGFHETIESAAVARYRGGREVAVVPVDLAEPSADFFRDVKEMFARVERTSAPYRRLMDRHKMDTRTDGFPYLNSARCIRAWSAIYLEVLDTLDWIREPRLHEIYARWCRQNELRDRAMMGAIEDYAIGNNLRRGLFLVGAAHRQAIVDKARKGMVTDPIRVEWDLDLAFDGLDSSLQQLPRRTPCGWNRSL